MNVLQSENQELSTTSPVVREPSLQEIERDVALLSATNFHVAPIPPNHSYGPLTAAEFEITGYIHDYLMNKGFNSPTPDVLELLTREFLSGIDIDVLIRRHGNKLTRRE